MPVVTKRNGQGQFVSCQQESAYDRFWAKVDKTDMCWIWTAWKQNKGYGQFRVNGRLVLSHRFAYELENGPIPSGLELDHLCKTPSCVRPSHLEAVNHRENCRRGLAGINQRRKMHCPQGHPYDLLNTYVYLGRRNCRQCHKEKGRVSSLVHVVSLTGASFRAKVA